MKKILLINQYYYPDIAATAQIFTDLGESLVRRGYDVSVICSGKSYTGNDKPLPKKEMVNGVTVYRLRTFGGGKKAGFARRILDFLSFYIMAFLKCMFLPKCNIVITLTTPPFVGMLGRLLQIFKRTKHIHWCMDLYPDIQLVHGMVKYNSFGHKIMARLNRSFIGKADVVCVLGSRMGDHISKYVNDKEKIKVAPVWADGKSLVPVAKENNWFIKENDLKEKFVVMYSGNIGLGSSFDTIFDGAAKLNDDNSIVFIFIGAGKQLAKIKELASERQLDNVHFLPYLDRKDIAYSLSAGNVHLVTIKPGLEGLKVPCKIYGIIATGRPMVFLGGRNSEVADLILENDLGRVIPEGDVDGFVEAIKGVKQNWADGSGFEKRARSVFEQDYNSEIAIDKMEKIIRSLHKNV